MWQGKLIRESTKQSNDKVARQMESAHRTSLPRGRFDALGSRRTHTNDVGEIRRVLNSFLQLLEKDDSDSIVIAATNHPDLLDKALFRRFDDVLAYELPDEKTAVKIIESRLAQFDVNHVDWQQVSRDVSGLSQGELVRASDEAAKHAVLQGTTHIATEALLLALHERKHASW